MQKNFTTSDISTIMLLILNNNNKLYDKTNLCKEVMTFFEPSTNNFSLCCFLFQWERLIANTNFILFKIIDNVEYIGIILNCDNFNQTTTTEPDNNFEFVIELKDTIEHICNNKTIYTKSKVLPLFLKKYFPSYSSAYELLICNKQSIGMTNIKNFINLYHNVLENEPNEIIDLIIEKKHSKNKNVSDSKSLEVIQYPTSKYNLVVGLGLISIGSLIVYKNPHIFKYISWLNYWK